MIMTKIRPRLTVLAGSAPRPGVRAVLITVAAVLALAGTSACALGDSPVMHVTPAGARDSLAAPVAAPQTDSLAVTAYYFHRTFRCETCIHMEQVIDEVLRSRFPDDLSRGRLLWQPLDYEEETNAPLYAGYGLTGGPALVLSRRIGHREVSWRELGEIWNLSDRPEELTEYLVLQIALSVEPTASGDGPGTVAEPSVPPAPGSPAPSGAQQE
jgi:hypothetical protein